MLETLAGPVPVAEGLVVACESLRRGLQADEVALLTQRLRRRPRWRAFAGPLGRDPAKASAALSGIGRRERWPTRSGTAWPGRCAATDGQRLLAVAFPAPGGPTVLRRAGSNCVPARTRSRCWRTRRTRCGWRWSGRRPGCAHQEAAALRRSQELQRGFLSRLSHELRTPLTAIRGYASSLMQPDVTWDGDSQQRFLDRIAAESARLGRLVGRPARLLGHRVGDAAAAARLVRPTAGAGGGHRLPATGQAAAGRDRLRPDLPAVWADHDRLEQVFVNLLEQRGPAQPAGDPGHAWPRAPTRPRRGDDQRGRRRDRDSRRTWPRRWSRPAAARPAGRGGPRAVDRQGDRRSPRRPRSSCCARSRRSPPSR